VSTTETTKPSGEKSRGFFAIYKPGQGKYVRWGTVVGLAILITAGGFWINYAINRLFTASELTKAIAESIFVLAGAFTTFMVVNRPRPAEFMIMTESEMRKVSWPTRQTVVNSTKVVIFLTLLLAVILWSVDSGFLKLFMWMKIL
jgi:preprotein translocase subunit SecE